MIAYSRGSGKKDNRPVQLTARDLDEFARALEGDHAPLKSSAAYICGPLNGVRRCKKGVLPRNWLAFDLDWIEPQRLGDVRAWFADRAMGIGWSTHSSTPEAPHERFIIVLDREANRDLCVKIGNAMTAALGAEFGPAVKVDPCCFLGEQPIFVRPTHSEVRRFGAAPLSTSELTDEARKNDGIPSSVSHLPFIWPSSVSDAIARTLPAGPGQRQKKLFEFARSVKALLPAAQPDELRAIAQQWHAAALPHIATKEFGVTLHDFMRAWDKVKVPVGPPGVTMAAALEKARSAQTPGGIERLGYGEAGSFLVRVCAALQQHYGSQPFFLAARKAGELLGMNHTDASRLLRTLVADKVLELAYAGNARQAARYRFIWPALPEPKG